MRKIFVAVSLLVALGGLSPLCGADSGEGTRRIVGSGLDVYFMNDRVFGTAGGHPLWAVYNCGSDIEGMIDIDGRYHKFGFQYHRDRERMITGRFGALEMSLGRVARTAEGFSYPVLAGGNEYGFTIRYETLEDGHLVNSVIEGDLGGKKLTLRVDGRLCPFATTGIIMIAAAVFSR